MSTLTKVLVALFFVVVDAVVSLILTFSWLRKKSDSNALTNRSRIIAIVIAAIAVASMIGGIGGWCIRNAPRPYTVVTDAGEIVECNRRVEQKEKDYAIEKERSDSIIALFARMGEIFGALQPGDAEFFDTLRLAMVFKSLWGGFGVGLQTRLADDGGTSSKPQRLHFLVFFAPKHIRFEHGSYKQLVNQREAINVLKNLGGTDPASRFKKVLVIGHHDPTAIGEFDNPDLADKRAGTARKILLEFAWKDKFDPNDVVSVGHSHGLLRDSYLEQFWDKGSDWRSGDVRVWNEALTQALGISGTGIVIKSRKQEDRVFTEYKKIAQKLSVISDMLRDKLLEPDDYELFTQNTTPQLNLDVLKGLYNGTQQCTKDSATGLFTCKTVHPSSEQQKAVRDNWKRNFAYFRTVVIVALLREKPETADDNRPSAGPAVDIVTP